MKENLLTLSVRKHLLQEQVCSRSSGDCIPSEKKLSEQYGVSITTIRRAVDLLISSGHLERRHGAGTFVRRPNGRFRVGMLVPEVDFTDFFPFMAYKLEKSLRVYGCDNSLFTAGKDHFDIDAVSQVAQDLDALLICGYTNQLEELKQFGLPCIFVGNEESVNAPYIGFDLVKAVQEQVFHLLEQGYRRIHFITHYSSRENMECGIRYHAFRTALHARGISFEPDMISACGTAYKGWEEKILSLIEQDDFDALICSTDEIAMTAVALLTQAGRRIPEDIGIAGCNNIIPVERHQIPLTTIDFNIDFLAEETAKFLNSRILAADQEANTVNLLIPLRLIIRESSDRRNTVKK